MATTPEQDQFFAKRAGLLDGSDWTQLPDAPLTTTKKAEWATYRQAIRDLGDTSDFASITFPDEPTD